MKGRDGEPCRPFPSPSFQAAYTGPVVMMSQNRQSEKDRLKAVYDYECNTKAEEEIRVIMEHLTHQDQLILDAIERLEARILCREPDHRTSVSSGV